MSEDETRDLYLYVTAYGYESACGYIELPPIRRDEDRWVTRERVHVSMLS